jgi:hypothetical protein
MVGFGLFEESGHCSSREKKGSSGRRISTIYGDMKEKAAWGSWRSYSAPEIYLRQCLTTTCQESKGSALECQQTSTLGCSQSPELYLIFQNLKFKN